MRAATSRQRSRARPDSSPRRMPRASLTSSALPMSRPKGSSMSVISAQTRLPAALPMRTISSARRRESSSVGISAREPVYAYVTEQPCYDIGTHESLALVRSIYGP